MVGLAVLLFSGCAPQPVSYRPALQQEGEIHLYLQPIPQEAHRIIFSISSMSAIREDGVGVPIPQFLSEFECRELIGVQKRLLAARVPPGSYKGLSIEIGEASLSGEQDAADLLVPDSPLFVEQQFTVSRRKATTLFLSLGAERLVAGGFRFAPEFSLANSRRQLKSLLGFVTNSESNVVYLFNKHTMEIVDAIATTSGPKGAAIDTRRDWVYIALAGDNAIEAIEVNTGEVLSRLQLRMGDEPTELALSGDGTILVSANYGSNTASIIDAGSLREVGRVILSAEPTSVVVGPSAARSYAFQPLAHAISILDGSRGEIATTQIFDESPVRGALSPDGNSLYAITRHSPNLLIINAATLELIDRVYVGAGAASIAVDERTGLIYVGKKRGNISVVDPSSLLPIDRFRVPGNVTFLAIDKDENSLFAVLTDRALVQKMDLVSKRSRGVVEIGEGSFAVVLMGSR